MPKYRGRVDCFINPTTDSTSVNSRMGSELFVNMVQHFSNSSDLGIEMIAANYGVTGGGGGTGFDFWDQTAWPGQRAWAAFRFHSASMGKFDCCIFVVTGTTVSTGGPNIQSKVSSLASTVSTALGISFACHPSGSNTGSNDGPWNGTTSLTSGTIGNPMWKLNTAGKGAFYPRSNGITGNTSASRNGMIEPVEDNGTGNAAPWKSHIILTEDSITLLNGHNDTSYKLVHFGPYLPRSGSVGLDSPYIMWTNGLSTNTPFPQFFATTIGVLTLAINGVDGAVAPPSITSGSRICALLTLSAVNSTIAYSNIVNSGTYEKLPVWACTVEAADNGILGTMKHVTAGYGMASNTVSTVSASAAFGTTTAAAFKFIIPWSGSYPGFSTNSRTGRAMSFDT